MVSDTDALFSEASDELQEDVYEHLETAEEALPDVEAVWELDGGNVIGVLNQLQSTLKVDEAEESFQEARKWYLMGEKADAFDDGQQTDLEERIEEVEDTLDAMGEVRDGVDELIPELPELKSALEDVSTTDEVDDGDVESDEAVEDDDGVADDEGDEDVENETDDGDESSGAAESWGSDDEDGTDDQGSLA
jgi:hypothetical protein